MENGSGLRIPPDYPLKTLPGYKGKSKRINIPKKSVAALKTISSMEGVFTYVTIFALFNTLIYQYTKKKDIIICSPFACRKRMETKNLKGYFNNPLPIRSRLDKNIEFRELMKQISAFTSDSIPYQEVPLQLLADSLPSPGTIYSSIMFTMQNVPNLPVSMHDISIIPIDTEDGIYNFDLSLSIKKK